MTKKEITRKVAKATGLTLKQSEGALDTIVDSVRVTLKQGRRITIPGLGTFYVARRKARTGRNPRTGEAIKIAASKLPKFRPGKKLKDLLGK